MASIRDIKQRMKNIESIEQLIRAMYMVSSTQLRRAEKQLENLIPIQESLQRKIEELKARPEIKDYNYFEKREIKNSLYLVFTGDMGLAGSYNNKVQKFALKEMEGKNESIYVIGSYGYRFFDKNKKNITKYIIDVADSKIYYGSETISKFLLESFLSREFDEVFVIYTEFQNVLKTEPVIKKILPFEISDDKPIREEFEPSFDVYIENLIPLYLHMSIFRAFSESHTSEHASRMIAMDSSSKNAKDLVEELQRNLNRQRQQDITQELAEIVGQKQ